VLNLLDAAVANPWGTLRTVVGDPLHPGGAAATRRLLDRADVGPGTRLLDVGCGAGGSLALAHERGADAVGVDRDPDLSDAPEAGGGPAAVRGDVLHLPVADGSVDVVLAECVLCLAPDLAAGLAEARRVLVPGGRLALSDVVVEGDLPELPPRLVEALCLSGDRRRDHLLDRVEAAGFAVAGVETHREDLLAMRDRAKSRVDYERLLPAFGERGRRLLDAATELERAVEDGRVGYVSLVARAE
jgi:SAM-dependent methyltransferase